MLQNVLGKLHAITPSIDSKTWVDQTIQRRHEQTYSLEGNPSEVMYWFLQWPLRFPFLGPTDLERLLCWFRTQPPQVYSSLLQHSVRKWKLFFRSIVSKEEDDHSHWCILWVSMIVRAARLLTRNGISTKTMSFPKIELHQSVLSALVDKTDKDLFQKVTNDELEHTLMEHETFIRSSSLCVSPYEDETYGSRSGGLDPLSEGLPCWLCPLNVIIGDRPISQDVVVPSHLRSGPFVVFCDVVVTDNLPYKTSPPNEYVLSWKPDQERGKKMTFGMEIAKLAHHVVHDQPLPIRLWIHPTAIAVAHQLMIAVHMEYKFKGKRQDTKTSAPHYASDDLVWMYLMLRDIRRVLWRLVTLEAILSPGEKEPSHQKGCPMGPLPRNHWGVMNSMDEWKSADRACASISSRSGDEPVHLLTEDQSWTKIRKRDHEFPRYFPDRDLDRGGHPWTLLALARHNASMSLRNHYGFPSPERWTPNGCCFCVERSVLQSKTAQQIFVQSIYKLQFRDVDDSPLQWLKRRRRSPCYARRCLLLILLFPHLKRRILYNDPHS